MTTRPIAIDGSFDGPCVEYSPSHSRGDPLAVTIDELSRSAWFSRAARIRGRVEGHRRRIDATNKWPGETTRDWGPPIVTDDMVKAKVDALYRSLDLGSH